MAEICSKRNARSATSPKPASCLVEKKKKKKEKSGKGIPVPFPFVDFKKLWDVVSDPTLFKGPEVSEKEGRAIVAEYKRQYNDYKRKGGTRSYGS